MAPQPDDIEDGAPHPSSHDHPHVSPAASAGLLRNTGVLVGSRLVVAALGWAGTVLIVRTLGQTEFGKFSLAFALLGTLSIVTNMGISRVALAGIIGADDAARSRVAGAYIVLRSILGVVGYGGAIGFALVAGYDDDVVHAIAVAGLVVVLATPSSALDVVFQATGKMAPIALASVLGQSAQMALTVALVLGPGTLVWLTVPAILNEVVALVHKIVAARALMPVRLRVDVSLWREMLREAVPLTIGEALETLYYRVDVLMLSWMAPFGAVGSYSVALKFPDLIHIVPSAMTAAVLPLLVAAWPSDMEGFRDAARESASVLIFAGGLALGGFLVFAEPVLELLFGAEFTDAATATRLLVASQCLTFLASLAFTCLVAAGRHHVYPFVSMAGLVVNVVFNLVLIPRYSLSGAAAASLLTLTVVAGSMMWLAHRIPGANALVPGRALGVLPALVALVAAGWLSQSVLPWPFAAALAAAAYTAVALGLRVVVPAQLAALVGRS